MKEKIYAKLQDKKFFRTLIEIKNGLPFSPEYSPFLLQESTSF